MSQALGSRLLIVVVMFVITAAMGDLCLPECGWERGGTVLLGLVATICQATMIKAIQIGWYFNLCIESAFVNCSLVYVWLLEIQKIFQ